MIKNKIRNMYSHKKKLKLTLLVSFTLSILFFLLILITPLPISKLKNFHSTAILSEDNSIIGAFLSKREQWCFPLDEDFIIPNKLKTSVLMFEDKYFYSHIGFNPVSIVKALYLNFTSGRVVMGGSTITMQLARIIDPKKRTYFNKLFELFQAFKLELFYSKEEILKMYLSYAPYGGNIVGIKAAALKYLKKDTENLTWAEAAMFAVLPNAPGKIHPGNKNHKELIDKRNRLLKRLFTNRVISKDIYDLSIVEPIPVKVHILDNIAPHLSRKLFFEVKSFDTKDEKKGKFSNDKINFLTSEDCNKSSNLIKTTIDVQIQKDATELLSEHIKYMKNFDVNNGACLIVENKTGKVRAYVGSQGFYDDKYSGQVDGILASRSPGSTLKPFLYALCFDEGLILPQSLIKDIPTYYGSFSPRNSTRKYQGIVRADEALIKSLNVPAVRLLNAYGVDNFYLFLKYAGVSTLFRSSDNYGLPLILGGSEVNIWDLAKMYRALGSGGYFNDLQIIASENKKNEIENKNDKNQFISSGASYLTSEILRDVKRPNMDYNWQYYTSNQWPLAWKTGTSYGYKDAWAVGYNPEWTIVVWVGNFSGVGNPAIIGAKAAGPLLFKLFSSLPKNPDLQWFKRKVSDFKKVAIWPNTGYFSNEDCKEPIYTDSPINSKVIKACPYHKTIYTTLDEKYRVNSSCWDGKKYKKITKTIFDADVMQFLRKRGYVLDELPPYHPDCKNVNGGAGEDFKNLTIIYPQNNTIIFIPKDFGGKKQKLILKAGHRDKKVKLFWYLNDDFIGETVDTHKFEVSLGKGKYKLVLVDENGENKSVGFTVESK